MGMDSNRLCSQLDATLLTFGTLGMLIKWVSNEEHVTYHVFYFPPATSA